MTGARSSVASTETSFPLVLGGGSLLHQVARTLDLVVDRELAALGLTSQQAALLLASNRAPVSPSDLRVQLGTDTAGLTRLLDRLEAKQLVRRRPHPDDRRSIVIEVTAQGRVLAPQIAKVFGRASRQLLNGFSAPELQRLTTALQRMLTNLEKGI